MQAIGIFSAAALMLSLIALKHGANPDPELQLDFWIGDWTCAGELTGKDGSKVRTEGTNSITREFDKKVVFEHFDSRELKGMSVSVYDPNAKLWRQTWVDNSGSYISFTGGSEQGQFIFTTGPRTSDGKRKARMVFRNIKADSFDWDWEKTKDGGKIWTNEWHLHYVRKAR